MTEQLAPTPVFKAWDNAGVPLNGGKLFTYIAGSTTKQASFTDSTGGTPNTNPVILNYRGEANIWLDPTKVYKVVLAPANDTDPPTNPFWTVDQISGGSLSPSGSIIPTVDNLFTLGSPSFSWANVYIGPNHAPVLDVTSGNFGYYARTVAEIAAGVTPTAFVWREGDIRRYGALVGAADNHLAFNQASAVSGAGGAAAYIPGGTWSITATITVAALSSIHGEGNASVISPTGCDGLTFSNDPGILPFTRFFKDFQILGVGITCQNFRAVYINFTVGSVVSGCLFENVGIRNFGGAYYIQGLEDSNFIGCQSFNTYYGFFFFQQSVTQALTDCIVQRGSIGAPSWGLGTGSIGVTIVGAPEQENLHITNCAIFAFDHLIDVSLCFELQIQACDLSNAILIAVSLGGALGPLVIRDNWIQCTNGAAATIGINIPNNTPTINNKQIIEGNYIRNDLPFAGSIGINVGNGNAGTVVHSNQTILFDKGIVLGASTGISCKWNTVNITQGNTAYSAASAAISLISLSIDPEIGPNYIIGGIPDAVVMTAASAVLSVTPTKYPVGTPVQFDASVNGFFTGVTYYVSAVGGASISVAAAPGGASILATGNTAINVFQAPLPVVYNAGTPAGMQLYARGSFIASMSGFTGAVTGPTDWVATGGQVSINVRISSNLGGTSNATTMTMANVPSLIWPLTTQQFLADVEDTGTFTYGIATMTSAGVMAFFKTPNLAPFTNSGVKALNTLPMTWLFT